MMNDLMENQSNYEWKLLDLCLNKCTVMVKYLEDLENYAKLSLKYKENV